MAGVQIRFFIFFVTKNPFINFKIEFIQLFKNDLNHYKGFLEFLNEYLINFKFTTLNKSFIKQNNFQLVSFQSVSSNFLFHLCYLFVGQWP